MDKHNLFFTRTYYNMERLDWAILMFLALGLSIYYWRDVNWWRFTFAFLLPDLIGTFPGLYTYYARRTGDHRSIPGVIHHLYNIGHSFAGVALVCGLWWLVIGRPEWAMLGFVIHLAGDRSVFGNIYKELGLAFEPVKHPAFERFERQYEEAGKW
jgi:phosphatidylglycerol lysyltransferase